MIGLDHPDLKARRATLLAAGPGGAALLIIALPSLVRAMVWPGDFDGNTLSDTGRTIRAVIAVRLPVGVSAIVAVRQRANVRISTLLVAVPQALLFAAVLLWFLLERA